jgi:hypothetical protein
LETDYEELLGKRAAFKNGKWPIFFFFFLGNEQKRP